MTTQVEVSESANICERLSRVPHLLQASLILLTLNVMVVLWFYFSPIVPAAAVSEPVLINQNRTSQTQKQSPFASVPVAKPRKAIKTPQRVEPVISVTPLYVPAFGSPAGNAN
jgi:hypothetical protein